MTCPTVFASDDETMFFETSEYHEQIYFFTSLGILNPEDEVLTSEEWAITRGEFVHLVVSCLNQKSVADLLDLGSSFNDVTADTDYNKEISFAEHSKLLSKIGGFLFNPEAELDADFAAKIAVNMTGREVYVGENKSHLSIADDTGFFKNVKFYDGNKINRGEALDFLKNVITTDILEVPSISENGNYKVELQKDKTILSSCFGLEKREGIVTSDGILTVYGDKVKSGYISVDGKMYLALCNDYLGMAGKQAEFYVKEDNGIEMIQSIEEKDNSILTLEADAITEFDPVNLNYKAYVDSKLKTLPIQRSAYIAYNYMPDYDADRMKPSSGVVKLIDHNNDGAYDVVLVYEFTNTIVDTYSSYSETIYDAEDSTYDIDLSSFYNYDIVDLKNNPVDPQEISKYSIVSLYKNSEENTAYIVVSGNTRKGVLKSINTSENVYEFSSTEYKLSKNIRFDKNKLEIGLEYDLFFDSLGEIVYIRTDGGTVAHLIRGGKNTGLACVVSLMVLPSDKKEATVYTLADNVKITRPMHSDTKMSAEKIYDDILTDGSGNFIPTMSLIRVNENEEITHIIFPKEILTYNDLKNTSEYPLYKLSYLTNDMPNILKSNAGLRWRNSLGGFNRWIILASGAQMFYVPQAGDTSYDKESIVVKPPNYSGDDTETLDNLSFYSTDKDDISVRYIVKESAGVDTSELFKTNAGVVTQMTNIYDEKLGVTWRLTIEDMGSSSKTLIAKEESVVLRENICIKDEDGDGSASPLSIRSDKQRIEVGDIIHYVTDGAGNISAIGLIWDAKSGIENVYDDNGDTAPRFGEMLIAPQRYWDIGGWTIVPGNIIRKVEDVFEISVDKTSSLIDLEDRLQRIKWGKKNKAILIDYSQRQTEVTLNGTADELIVGDRIVVVSYTGQSYIIVAYRR